MSFLTLSKSEAISLAKRSEYIKGYLNFNNDFKELKDDDEIKIKFNVDIRTKSLDFLLKWMMKCNDFNIPKLTEVEILKFNDYFGLPTESNICQFIKNDKCNAKKILEDTEIVYKRLKIDPTYYDKVHKVIREFNVHQVLYLYKKLVLQFDMSYIKHYPERNTIYKPYSLYNQECSMVPLEFSDRKKLANANISFDKNIIFTKSKINNNKDYSENNENFEECDKITKNRVKISNSSMPFLDFELNNDDNKSEIMDFDEITKTNKTFDDLNNELLNYMNNPIINNKDIDDDTKITYADYEYDDYEYDHHNYENNKNNYQNEEDEEENEDKECETNINKKEKNNNKERNNNGDNNEEEYENDINKYDDRDVILSRKTPIYNKNNMPEFFNDISIKILASLYLRWIDMQTNLKEFYPNAMGYALDLDFYMPLSKYLLKNQQFTYFDIKKSLLNFLSTTKFNKDTNIITNNYNSNTKNYKNVKNDKKDENIISILTERIMKVLEIDHVYIAGGSLIKMICDIDPGFSDIDIWICNQSHNKCSEILNILCDGLKHTLYKHNSIVTIIYKDVLHPIQLIFCDSKDGRDIVNTFDFSHLRAFYDGKNVYTNPLTIQNWISKTSYSASNNNTKSHIDEYYDNNNERINKTLRSGFFIIKKKYSPSMYIIKTRDQNISKNKKFLIQDNDQEYSEDLSSIMFDKYIDDEENIDDIVEEKKVNEEKVDEEKVDEEKVDEKKVNEEKNVNVDEDENLYDDESDIEDIRNKNKKRIKNKVGYYNTVSNIYNFTEYNDDYNKFKNKMDEELKNKEYRVFLYENIGKLFPMYNKPYNIYEVQKMTNNFRYKAKISSGRTNTNYNSRTFILPSGTVCYGKFEHSYVDKYYVVYGINRKDVSEFLYKMITSIPKFSKLSRTEIFHMIGAVNKKEHFILPIEIGKYREKTLKKSFCADYHYQNDKLLNIKKQFHGRVIMNIKCVTSTLEYPPPEIKIIASDFQVVMLRKNKLLIDKLP